LSVESGASAATELDAEDLSRQTISGLRWQLLAGVVRFISQFGIGIALARLLPPEDFGIVGIATIVTGFAATLANLGLGPALVQRKEVTERHIRVAYTLSLGVSVFMTLGLYASAAIVAAFFNDSRVAAVLQVLSLTFLFTGFGIVSGALLTRRLAFRVIVTIELLASIIGYGGVAVAMAIAGYGYWSLVGGMMVQTVLSTSLKYIAARHSLRPLVAPAEIRHLVGFSLGVSLEGTANYFARQGDYFVVGRMMSATSLGYYARAYALMTLPLTFLGSALSRVLFPAASRVQHDRERFRRAYLTTLSVSVAVALPISLSMVILAPELILTLYGAAWAPTIPLLQILALFGAFRMSYNNAAAFIHARGRAYGLVVSQIVYGAMVVGGSWWVIGELGLQGVAWVVGVAIGVMWILVVAMANNAAAVPFRQSCVTLGKAAMPGILVGMLVFAFVTVLRAATLPSFLVLFLGGGAAAIATAVALYHQGRALNHPTIHGQLDRVAALFVGGRVRFDRFIRGMASKP
jgi:O-antigen/teichoic acid export membrane protein